MSSDRNWIASARLVGVGLLAGLAVAWVFGGGRVPSVRAQGQAAPPSDSGTIAFTTTAPNGNGQHLYVIDTKTQAFAVYRVDPQDPKGAVKLEAARQYRWDLKLAEFNNHDPHVAAVEAMVGGGSAPTARR